jgi:fumarate hydratase class II
VLNPETMTHRGILGENDDQADNDDTEDTTDEQ